MKIGNRTILWQDILVVLAFVLFFGAGFLSSFVLAEVGKYTEFANRLESDPITRTALDLGFSILMVQFVTIALLAGLYYMARRNYTKNKCERTYMLLSMFSIYVLLICLQNFMNDLPIALKLFMGG